ncbi:MAG: fumarylacetoacetate hydrolase family protein [Parvularcula sp.]|jgi:2-keto-4-pentenoate hydratase|nr:fumarylacetoacetate hydrolase family protein [Parvularcula sp.]
MERADLLSSLVQARSGGDRISEPASAPRDLAAAYSLSERMMNKVAQSSPAGWKVGATSAGAQEFLKVEEPIRGRIFAEGLTRSPAAVPYAEGIEAEPEILFRLKQGVTAAECRDRAEALRAIASVHVGLEINRPSYREPFDAGALRIVADNAAHLGLVIGPEIAIEDFRRVSVTLKHNRVEAGSGTAEAVLGDPLRSLLWLANDLPDQTLMSNAWIATGGMCRGVQLSPGDVFEAEFLPGGVARLTVEDIHRSEHSNSQPNDAQSSVTSAATGTHQG